MAKTRVAVLFGGVSSEYEISCISAANVVENLSQDKYEVIKIGITKKGRWLQYPGGTEMMRDGSWAEFPDCVPAFLSPDRTTHGLVVAHGPRFDIVKVDIVFPVLHGRNGEDGTVQGLLDLAGIPYVGCGLLASAMCMDKATANRTFDECSIPHTAWLEAGPAVVDSFEEFCEEVEAKLGWPVFVKPSVGGSSVGVTKAKDADSLNDAVKLALAHDRKLVIEKAVVGKEVECAVLGNQTGIFASLPGEIESCNEIYDYEAKYQSGDASRLYLPARLTEEKQLEVKALAEAAYAALGCTGLSRVDFFVEEGTGRVLLNEINTLPGFTSISMYPKLMEMSGIPQPELMDRLIALGFERSER